MVTVSPVSNTGYTVVGSQAGCSGKATIFVNVKNLPSITASASSGVICADDQLVLTASGAVTYSWVSNSQSFLLQGSTVTPPTPPLGVTTSYTVTGVDQFGCTNKALVTVDVEACTGLSHNTSLSGLSVYPNPTSGALTLEVNGASAASVEISDVTGRIVLTDATVGSKTEFDLSTLANGIYYVKVQSDASVEVVKIIKQ
jgi:hypothetical protein